MARATNFKMQVTSSFNRVLLACFCLLQIEFVSACVAKDSQPNPIASQYPNSATGTINGTVSIIPIPYAQARSIVPAQYPILKKAYQQLMPGLGNGMYPAMLQIELDHDVQSSGTGIPDFQRAALYYPFVDRLNDGYTSMAYSTYIMLSNNTLAIAGTQTYGYTVDVSKFVPNCEAYQASGSSGAITQKATSFTSSAKVTVNFSPSSNNAWSIDAYKNLTNQPTFSNAPGICDHYVRLYNTTVTEGQYAPQNIKGSVSVVAPFYPQTQTFTGIYGLKMDNAFIETNYVPCTSLQGYTASGPGD